MTTTNDDELARLRTAFAAPGPALEPESCPPPDRIWLAIRGELPPDELREIVDHAAVCPACAEDWRIAMAFEEEARADLAASPRQTRVARPGVVRYRAWMAVAATILVAVIGFQLRRPGVPPPQPGYRSGEGQTVESLLPKDASLPRRHFVLSWKAATGAASYDLIITTGATMTTLDEAKGLTATTYTVPESALAGLEPGAKVLWTVTPVSRDGGRLQPLTSTVHVADQ